MLGNVKNISAILPTRRSTVPVVGADGKETGIVINATAPDNVLIQGELVGGTVVSIHYRGFDGEGTFTKESGINLYCEFHLNFRHDYLLPFLTQYVYPTSRGDYWHQGYYRSQRCPYPRRPAFGYPQRCSGGASRGHRWEYCKGVCPIRERH